MKICLLCSEYPPSKHGGIGPVTRQLAEGLVALGHVVHVVGLYVLRVDIIETIAGVTVHRLSRVGRGVFGELRSRLKLTRYLEELHRNIQYNLFEAPEWRGDTAWLRVDAPVVLRLHTSHVVDRLVTGQSRHSRFIGYFEEKALYRASRVCSVSNDIAQKTASAFPLFRKRMALQAVPIILNAIELQQFRPGIEPRQDALLVFAGSLKPKKGIENLLKAFDIVVKRTGTGCCLALAGADTKTRTGESYFEECFNGISPEARQRLQLLGICTREEIARLFSRATTVILPSLQEACPMVVMEAMACGAPTIFGACGPHAEIINDGVDGLICDPRSPNDIANKILLILDHPRQAAQLGLAARLKAEDRFTTGRFMQQTLDFYRETIEVYGRRNASG